MDCEIIRRRGIADEYRSGRLSTEETDAYEQHYYACDGCFEDLRFRDRVAVYLREEGERLFGVEPAVSAGTATQSPDLVVWPETETDSGSDRREDTARSGGAGVAGSSSDSRPSRRAHGVRRPERVSFWDRLLPGPIWTWGLGLVAASVLCGIVIGNYQGQRNQLRRLSFVAAYPYVASELRSDEGPSDFGRAMEVYGQRRYAEAGPLLESAARTETGDPDVQFYLGVVQLLTNRPRPAVVSLRKAVDLAPASGVYRWYLVQALLLMGDRAAVLRELNILAAGVDETARRARLLRSRILEGE